MYALFSPINSLSPPHATAFCVRRESIQVGNRVDFALRLASVAPLGFFSPERERLSNRDTMASLLPVVHPTGIKSQILGPNKPLTLYAPQNDPM